MATVFSMVSSKGGAGKTTGAILLAAEIAERGRTVVLVDADPNQPLVRWSQLHAGLPKNISVIADEDKSGDTIQETIDQARNAGDFVIVDLEGRGERRGTLSIAESDLVLIPTQPSDNDAAEAIKAVRAVRQMSRASKTDIPYAIFLTRCKPVAQEKTHKAIRTQFKAGGLNLLDVELIDRAAYRSMFSFGGTPYTLRDSQVGGLEMARQNMRNFYDDVIGEYKRQRAAA